MTYESLLKNVPIQDSNIFRMSGEVDPEREANHYAAQLQTELPVRNDLPLFDLILLGMGDDGHTASIFPDNMSLLNSDDAVAVAVHPTSGQKRITLTGKVINQAEQVVFLITGSSKAAVLKQVIQRTKDFKKFPASYIQSYSGPAEFYLDKAAAAEL
jgi:6-phosphogluconolactonase